jgi:hypothetical protein
MHRCAPTTVNPVTAYRAVLLPVVPRKKQPAVSQFEPLRRRRRQRRRREKNRINCLAGHLPCRISRHRTARHAICPGASHLPRPSPCSRLLFLLSRPPPTPVSAYQPGSLEPDTGAGRPVGSPSPRTRRLPVELGATPYTS